MRAVLVIHPQRRHQCQRLVDHIRNLDGTEVLTFEPASTLPYPHCANEEFHLVAETMRGEPYVWLEWDSIPLEAGWLTRLEREYYRQGKHFMISASTNPPHDMVGGIGVYGPGTNWLIPKSIHGGIGFDGWLVKHLPNMVSKTNLIHHSYGGYDDLGHASVHLDPQPNQDAVVFHADKLQRLLPKQNYSNRSFFHNGDLGDIIAFLPILRHVGGGELVIGGELDGRVMTREKFYSIKPLLELQPYVKNVTYGTKADVDMSGWRMVYKPHRTITQNQALFLGIDGLIDMSPWLDVEPHEAYKGSVVCARSPRYHNNNFRWYSVLFKHKFKKYFIGTLDEYSALKLKFTAGIMYAKTPSLLDVARVIKASRVFVGNQSCPFWIAAGLGVDIIQERFNLDSTILRANIKYVDNTDEIVIR